MRTLNLLCRFPVPRSRSAVLSGDSATGTRNRNLNAWNRWNAGTGNVYPVARAVFWASTSAENASGLPCPTPRRSSRGRGACCRRATPRECRPIAWSRVLGELDDPFDQTGGVGAIVVGLPRRLDGDDTDKTRRRASWHRALHTLTGLEVHLQDERLSSHEAEQRLAEREPDWRRAQGAARRRGGGDHPSGLSRPPRERRCTTDGLAHEALGARRRDRGDRLPPARLWWVHTRLDDAVPRVHARPRCSSSCRRARASAAIASDLAAAGVVADPLTFRLAARLSGADRRLQAGEYRFAEPARPSRSSIGSRAATCTRIR